MMPTFEPVVLVDDRCTERLNWYSKFEKVLPDGTKLFTESQLQQAYEAGKRDAVPEWLPIETAPEATHVFVWLPNYGTVRGIFTTDQSRQRWWNGEEVIYPTHWMPLPTAPKGENHG